MTYTYYVALQTTGQVVGELELINPQFNRRLQGGTFSAQVDLNEMDLYGRRDAVEITRPGKYSIVVDRDGQVFGEWFIWTRSRPGDGTPMTIGGTEAVSHLEHRLLGAYSYANVEQLFIARDMVMAGFGGEGGPGTTGEIVVEVPVPTASGRSRDRNYELAESSNGARLKELSEVDDGFEYDIITSWKEVSGRRYVRRVFQFYYPRKGTLKPFIFDLAGESGYEGNGLNLSVSEDARSYASQSWARGQEILAATSVGDTWLGQGFPYRQVSETFYSVKEQPTLDAHAVSVQQASQIASLPADLSVAAEGTPNVLDYDTGDLVWCQADPSPNFPDGWGGQMRILGISIRPEAEGEGTADLELTTPDGVHMAQVPSWESLTDNMADFARRITDLEQAKRSFALKVASDPSELVFSDDVGARPLNTWVSGSGFGPDLTGVVVSSSGCLMVVITADLRVGGGENDAELFYSYAVVGPTSSAANTGNALRLTWSNEVTQPASFGASHARMYTGLTPGTYDIVSSYRCNSAGPIPRTGGSIKNRHILAVPF